MSWTLIERQYVTTPTTSLVLGSGGTIPQTYKSLKLVVSARTTGTGSPGNEYVTVAFNGTATITGKACWGYGSGVNVGSPTSILAFANGANDSSSTHTNSEIVIPNYSSTTTKIATQQVVLETNATTSVDYVSAYTWSLTSPITSITLTASNSLVSGSTFTLYGLQ